MNRYHSIFFLSIAALLAALLIASSPAQADQPALPLAGAPQVVSYQGQVMVNDQPFTGTGYFKFAIVNLGASTIYWTNDGSLANEPSEAVALAVNKGLFNVLLGDTAIPHMVALPASVFSGTDRYLRVWFSVNNITFALLTPDQRIAAAPYALQAEEAKNADMVDGLHANTFASTIHNHWAQSWTGTGTGLTLSGGTTGLTASGASYGVYGSSSSTGVYGSGNSYGVYGTTSTDGAIGTYGVSTSIAGSGSGVYGRSSSPNGSGGYFYNSSSTGNAIGVYGYSGSSSGVAGYFVSGSTLEENATSGVYGKAESDTGFGVAGHNYYSGVGVGAWSYFGNLIEAYDGDYPGGTLRFYVDQSGNIYADGSYGTFGTSSQDGATHATASVQSTEAWLEDFGRAWLVNGAAKVEIAADFAGMADMTLEYHVFLTPMGDSQGLYVSNLTSTSFEVHEQGGGTSSIEFSYRIVARPAGSGAKRLPRVEISPADDIEPERLPESEK